MMRFFWRLLLPMLALAAISTTAAEPEQFLSADAPVVFRIDCKRALERLNAALKQSDSDFAIKFKFISSTLKNVFNIELSDCFSGQAWGMVYPQEPQSARIYLKTRLPEKSFETFFTAAIQLGNKANWQIIKSGDRNVYTVAGRSDSEKFAIFYAADDVIRISRIETVAIREVIHQVVSLPDQFDLTSMIAMNIDVSKITGSDKFPQVRQCSISLDLQDRSGQEIITLLTILHCSDRDTAKQLNDVFQFALPAFIGALYSNSPALGLMQTAAVRVKRDKTRVIMKYRVTGQELQEVIKYFADPANKQLINQVFKELNLSRK